MMALYRYSTQRTILAPLADVFRAWADASALSAWMGTGFTMDFRCGGRFRTEDGSRGEYLAIVRPTLIRFTWESPAYEPGSFVEVHLLPRGPNVTSCELQHLQLHTADDAGTASQRWTWALDSLQAWLETGMARSAYPGVVNIDAAQAVESGVTHLPETADASLVRPAFAVGPRGDTSRRATAGAGLSGARAPGDSA
jgi:uncharacterized protein YndB with AHSA1/START domain